MHRPITAISSSRKRPSCEPCCELVDDGSRAISSRTRALKEEVSAIADQNWAPGRGFSQGRHYRESLFWTVRSFESRSGRRAPPRGACDHGRPRAAPRQINARSWERHFQRRDAIFVIALLERLHHMSLILCERLHHMSHFREARR